MEMTDMTTTQPTKPTNAKPASDDKSPATPEVEMITLDQLAREMKIPPRDARMLLRLAAKQTKLYPTLGKDHVARQPWQWVPGSKALDEAKRALAVDPAS
jgi:hypothetical protein